MVKVLITGITGQDGSYLAELLLSKGYEVHGLMRRVAVQDPHHYLKRLEHVKDKITLHEGCLESYECLLDLFEKIQPDECYHLAAQSFVGLSFKDPFGTFKTNATGTHHVIEALRKKAPGCKLYFAATSELFGKVQEVPQSETTRFYPRSPYGVSKQFGFDLIRNYRDSYSLFMCSGILFNHESPRRGQEFVTRKITRHIARIKKGESNVLVIGNVHARRDWGYAKDYVEAMWLMLQRHRPDDYVIATGVNHSVLDFVNAAFNAVGLSYELKDHHDLSMEEADRKVKEYEAQKDKIFVVQHPRFYRPAEVDALLGDPSKAKRELGWEPKTTFAQLVAMMVEDDLKNI
jgi:GDPmannose 4,6-dehydratase